MTDNEYLEWLVSQCKPQLNDIAPSDAVSEARFAEAIRTGVLTPEDAERLREVARSSYSEGGVFHGTWLVEGLRASTLVYVRHHPSQDRLSAIPVGLLPTHALNGCAIRTPSGGTVIALDSGLVHAISMLAFCYWSFYTWPRPDAFCHEYTQDDLARSVIALAEFCLTSAPDAWNRMPAGSLLVKMRDPMLLSQLTIACRQFVLLHEYGHIALGHLNPMRTKNLTVQGERRVEVEEYSKNHLMEFEADRFAIDHAIQGQQTGATFPVEHFGLAIGLIYRFFDLCEALTGSRHSSTHPPGVSRWLRLRQILSDAVGRPNARHPVDFIFDGFLYESGLPPANMRDPNYVSLYQPGRPPILL